MIEILGVGYGLHWEALNVDLSIPGLLAGIFGTKAYIARRAGRTTSPAKGCGSTGQWRKGWTAPQECERLVQRSDHLEAEPLPLLPGKHLGLYKHPSR